MSYEAVLPPADQDPKSSSSEHRNDGPAISIQDLGKRYKLYDSVGNRLKEIMHLGRRSFHRDFWALKDVCAEIRMGETIGVVGRNGAGKSTLLQIICGTVAPTVGSVEIYGRVAALLELGAGFHPEFTGEENVYMNAAIMGMSRPEIDDKYEAIVDFSGIRDFIKQPVKSYSNGMYVRLAFAVAINVDPDILVVDEALSVGDALYRHKCYAKCRELQAAGKTVIFVTHSEELLGRLCSRAIVMDEGRIHFSGTPHDALNVYRDLLYGMKHRPTSRDNKAPKSAESLESGRSLPEVDTSEEPLPTDVATFLKARSKRDNFPNRRSYNPDEYRYGDFRARLIDYLVVSGGRCDIASCSADEPIDVYIRAYVEEDLDDIVLGLTVQTTDGMYVFGSNTLETLVEVQKQHSGDFLFAKFSFTPRLVSGVYLISLGIAHQDVRGVALGVDRRYNAIALTVTNRNWAFGIADLSMKIEVGLQV